MPAMVVDEVILLVDTYFKTRETGDEQLKKIYIEGLSNSLRKLPFFPEFCGNPTFRNTTGLYLLLMNIDYVMSGRWENIKISKLKRDVIKRYQNELGLLNAVTQAIKFISSLNLSFNLGENFYSNFLGGSLLLYYHKYLETRGPVAVSLLRQLTNENYCNCSLCSNNLSNTYGKNAVKLLEIHLAAPITWYTSIATPLINQFIWLCPSCHKFAHSDVSLLTEINLSELSSKGE